MRTPKARLPRILFLIILSACGCGIPAGTLRGQILVNYGVRPFLQTHARETIAE